MKAITHQWLEYAKADLKSCENNINDEFLTNIVAFHSQQTVEKCFKAIIDENSLKLDRIHNLFKLYSTIETFITFEMDLEKLELLDNVYTTSRYPGEIGLLPFGKPNQVQVTEMFEFAKYVYEKTVEMIGVEL
jgi:HEPN domain-containing protein